MLEHKPERFQRKNPAISELNRADILLAECIRDRLTFARESRAHWRRMRDEIRLLCSVVTADELL